MSRKLKFIPVLIIILAVTMACGFSFGNSEAEETSSEEMHQMSDLFDDEESEEPVAEEVEIEEPLSIPTEAPAIVDKPEVLEEPEELNIAPAFEIETELYVSPSGAFELYTPVGWEIDENEYGGTSWISEDEVGYMYIAVTNTGYQLDEAGFRSFIEGYEQNTFSYYDNYEVVDTDEQYQDGWAWIYKNLDYDGVPQYVASYYHLLGQGVYNIDYWVNLDEAEAYAATFDIIHQSVQMDNTSVPNLPIYHWVTNFTDRNGFYQISIPRPWYYTTEEDTNLYIDSFISPDGNGLIENMAYDDGTTISKGDAGRIALYLLNNYYTSGSGDIKVTGDKVQPDGSERLDWTSRAGGYHGQSFFETRGTTFLMLSTIYTEGYDFYSEPFDMIISSYTSE